MKTIKKKVIPKKKKKKYILNDKVERVKPLVESFNTIITRCGNSGHISVSKSMVGEAFQVCVNKIFDKKLVDQMQRESVKRKRL